MRSTFNITAILILIVAVVSTGLAQNSSTYEHSIDSYQQAELQPLTFLSVKGKKIIDEKGNEIKLRGLHFDSYFMFSKNMYAAIESRAGDPDELRIEFTKYYFSDYDIREFKNMGANVVRIGFKLWEIEREPHVFNEKFMKLLDDIISQWGKNGIYVILDLHSAGQNFLNHNRQYGNILWKNKSFQDRVVSLWAIIANRYKDNPYIAGYDIINEPQAPSKKALHTFYKKIIDSIRERDKKHIIILQWDQKEKHKFAFGGIYNDPDIVLSTHFYKPHEFTSQGRRGKKAGYKYPAKYRGIYWDRRQIDKYFSNLTASIDRPLFVGEFSATYWSSGECAMQWIKDVITVLNENGAHYTFFSYKTHLRNSFGLYVPRKEIVQQTNYLKKNILTKQPSSIRRGV